MSRWIDHLEELGLLKEEAVAAAEDRARPAIEESQRLPEVSMGVDSLWAGYQQSIQAGQSHSNLSESCDQIDAAYQAGRPSLEEAAALAMQADDCSRRLPGREEGTGEKCLSDLFAETPIRRVRSRVLREHVLFAADEARIPPGNDLAVYRESELRQLVGRRPEQLKGIHAVKKTFDGEVVDLGEEAGETVQIEIG